MLGESHTFDEKRGNGVETDIHEKKNEGEGAFSNQVASAALKSSGGGGRLKKKVQTLLPLFHFFFSPVLTSFSPHFLRLSFPPPQVNFP